MLERSRRAWAQVPLRARLALLLVAGLLALQAASLWWALSERAASVRRAAFVQQLQRAADLVAVIDVVPPNQREAVAAALPYPVMRLDQPAQPEDASAEVVAAAREVWARRLQGRPVSVLAARGPLQRARPGRTHGLRIVLGTSLRDGQLAQVEVEVGQPAFRTDGLLGPFVLLGVLTALLVVLAMRLVLRPLEQLALGAEVLGTGLEAKPLAEEGPPEVRRAAGVLNRLHARLKEHVQGRVRSLAAISHDLRTPITRLRLRAEWIADAEVRTSFTRDLRQLEEMVQGTLAYLRGIGEAAPLEPVDLDGLLSQALEDVDALGALVAAPEPTGLVVRAHAPALRRALVNLLRNTVEHASGPELAVDAEGGVVRIHVLDRGPGIPESEIARVVQPFEQLDPSRGGSQGAGLGLSIVNEVAVRHGGRLVIRNRPGGGLCATLELALAG